MQSHIIIASSALHTIKAYKSLDALRKHIESIPKLCYPGYTCDRIRDLKKYQGYGAFDTCIELSYTNGYKEELRIQRLPIL